MPLQDLHLPNPSARGHRLVVLFLILLLAFALRTYKLGDQNIWWDEGLAVWAARKGFAQMTLWTAADVHPPLYFWLLWPWTRLTGESEFALRYLTAILAVLNVPLLYQVGRLLIDRRTGLLAAFLLSIARFHVWWSQEMRMYMLAGTMVLLSLYFLLKILRRPRSALWISYVLATVGALYTVYLSVVILLAENLFVGILWLIDSRKRWRFLTRWIVAQVAVLLLLVPWLVLALPRMRSWSVIEKPASLRFVLQLFGTLLSLGISTHIGRYALPVLGFGLLCLAGVALALTRRVDKPDSFPRSRWQILLFLVIVLALPPFVVWTVTQPRSLFYAPQVEARYFLPFAAPFYLLLAWSVTTIKDLSRPLAVLALVFVVGSFTWSLPQHYQGRYLRDEFQSMVRVIRVHAQPHDAVLLVSANRYPLFLYYYNRGSRKGPQPPVYTVPEGAETVTTKNVESELAAVASQHDRLWLAAVGADMQDPKGLVRAWLEDRYAQALDYSFAHRRLTLFADNARRPSVPLGNLTPDHPLDVRWEDGTEVLGYDLPTREFRANDAVRLGLYLRTSESSALRVAVVNGDGQKLEERAVATASEQTTHRQLDFTVFDRTPPGIYHFRISRQNQDAATTVFGEFRITGTDPPAAVEAIPHRVKFQLGDSIELVGYALQGPDGDTLQRVRPGDDLILDLYWRAQEKVDERYTVFTHLLGQAYNPSTAGPVWAQHDSEPLNGGYPTHQWFVGEIVRDRHRLKVDATAPAGEYGLEAGMYRVTTGERLTARTEGGQATNDRILLETVQVQP